MLTIKLSCPCFYISLILLAIQFLVYIVLLYALEDKGSFLLSLPITNPHFPISTVQFQNDMKTVAYVASELQINFIAVHTKFIYSNQKLKQDNMLYITSTNPVLLAIDSSILTGKMTQLLRNLIEKDFVPITFYNILPSQTVPELKDVETALFLQRTINFQIIILHAREDNTWWFGDIHSDSLFEPKLSALNLSIHQLEVMKTEGAIERFETVPALSIEESRIHYPKDPDMLMSDLSQSKFIECNYTRAAVFHHQFGFVKSIEATRFRHKVWKMLSRAKVVLDSLGIVFWLSSGTALGYFRECDIIAHSKDVDIGIWASSYTDQIISEMQNHGFHLKISLGFPNDSLELSFVDKSGIKLDMFFFYKEESHYWNGGTQVKSGKKFKYLFPKFTLCWTLFKDLRVRIPCKIEDYIFANYGPHWFKPVKTWDWKTSPSNVKPNGVWRTEQLNEAIKLYP